MNYFLDTEFLESGPSRPLSLLSIGIVSDDDREFYAESEHQDLQEAVAYNPWLKDNVLPTLLRGIGRSREEANLLFNEQFPGAHGGVMRFDDIKTAITKYIGEDQRPVFWGYFCSYDWVLFAQIFGRMIDLPRRFPMYCRDLRQEMDRLKVSKLEIPPLWKHKPHNALSDARWTKSVYKHLVTKGLSGY